MALPTHPIARAAPSQAIGRLPVAPFVAPYDGDINQRLALVAQAINRKADLATEPNYLAIMLTAPDGSTWRVTVSTGGVLQTDQVPRT